MAQFCFRLFTSRNLGPSSAWVISSAVGYSFATRTMREKSPAKRNGGPFLVALRSTTSRQTATAHITLLAHPVKSFSPTLTCHHLPTPNLAPMSFVTITLQISQLRQVGSASYHPKVEPSKVVLLSLSTRFPVTSWSLESTRSHFPLQMHRPTPRTR